MLAARVDRSLHFVYPDRGVQEVVKLDVPEGMYVTHSDVIARGDLVAVYAVVTAFGGKDGPAPYVELAVVHVDGTLRYHDKHAFAYEGWGADSQLVGNEEGLFVLTLMEVQTELGLVWEDGAIKKYSQRMAARSDPDAAGRLVVWDAESSSSADLHFFDTQAGTILPSQYVSLEWPSQVVSSPAVVGAGLLYLRPDPPRLVFEDASGSSALPIDVELDPSGYAVPGYWASGEYRVFGLGGTSPETARYLTARFSTGEVREIRLKPPPGYKLPADYWNAPLIDGSGRVMVILGAGKHMQLFATKDGSTWEALGLPVGDAGYPVTVREAGGAVIFDGLGGGEKVEGALPAGTAQLIGPQGGEGIVLVRVDPGGPDNPLYAEDEISADGGCVAYFRSGSLHVVETADYSSSNVGLTAATHGVEMAWIPLGD